MALANTPVSTINVGRKSAAPSGNEGKAENTFRNEWKAASAFRQ